MGSNHWMAFFAMVGPLTFSLAAQPNRKPIQVSVWAGVYSPLTEFGVVGVAHGEETAAPSVGIALAHDFGGRLSLATSVTWVRGVDTRVRPTPACTQRCQPGTISGGRVAIGLATLSWRLPTPVGLFSLDGGLGFKAYRNGDAISACDDQFCFDAGAFQESLTNVAGQIGVGWRLRETLPLGLRLMDVVSRYKTGRQQHDILLLLELRLL